MDHELSDLKNLKIKLVIHPLLLNYKNSPNNCSNITNFKFILVHLNTYLQMKFFSLFSLLKFSKRNVRKTFFFTYKFFKFITAIFITQISNDAHKKSSRTYHSNLISKQTINLLFHLLKFMTSSKATLFLFSHSNLQLGLLACKVRRMQLANSNHNLSSNIFCNFHIVLI